MPEEEDVQDAIKRDSPNTTLINETIEQHVKKIDRGKSSYKKESLNKNQVELSKNIFVSWDEDGSGVLEGDELIRPLLALGLANDQRFAYHLLETLDPHAGKPGHNELSIQM